jgi:enhancing lycopene biosynthesis protein 2
MRKRIGVVLSGCGVKDGSEIHEAVSIVIALDRRGAEIVCVAPNVAQSETVDHLTGKPVAERRNVLEESARIARGKIRDLASVKAAELDAVVLPGGFGAAKNLSSFATQGPQCTVNDQVARLLNDMHAAGKPIGLACIAPVIAARLFGRSGDKPRLTIGTDRGTAQAIEKMGGVHQNTDPTGVCVDESNRLVTTPCYMNDVGPWVVYQGADRMVEEVLRLAGEGARLHEKRMAASR